MGNGPLDSKLVGLNILPIDTLTLADGTVLTFVKANGDLEFKPGTGGGGGVTSVNSMTGAIVISAGTGISVSAGGGTVTITLLPLAFARGGTLLTPSAPINVIIWQATFACTVTNVRGYVVGATGSTVNARKNGTLTHLSSDLTLGSTGTWLDGGAVQNTAYVANDSMEIMLTGVGGSPTELAIQVDLTRP
jgi:hypothetical protein